MQLTSEQQHLLDQPIHSKVFLRGSAGTGKTTAGVHWLKKLLSSGVPAHQILVFVPQRTLASPYLDCQRDQVDLTHSLCTTMTLGGLARRMVELFWPLISEQAGFAKPNQPPHFLTMETAQYYMAHIVKPLIEQEGYFTSLAINRNRIYSQIIDNLNKAAFVGFPYEEFGARLKSAWIGNIEQLNIYDDAQDCANRFRQFCLAHNLLDFSLQVEVFHKYLWRQSTASHFQSSPEALLCREYLISNYRHLIVDNLEEDTPVAHDILREWLPDFESAVLIFDEDAGYRFFLGADVASAASLQTNCDTTLWFTKNLVNDPAITHLKGGIKAVIARLQGLPELPTSSDGPTPSYKVAKDGLHTPDRDLKYFPTMIKWVADEIAVLIENGVSPGEIVVLAPFMSDVLRFSLSKALDVLNIPHQSHRPSRALRDETAVQTLLTLAAVTFPNWGLLPKRINLALALMEAINGMDLVRAQLLTSPAYDQTAQAFPLKPFEVLSPDLRDRVTYRVGERYDRLRNWLERTAAEEELSLDFFLNRLFGEVLSQPGFGFHEDFDGANSVATLIESIQKFRLTVAQHFPLSELRTSSIGKHYIEMVQDGVIAAQYIRSWETRSQDSVFLAPAYTFLISNQPVDYQFWLDIGSPSWYQRLNQPLTHPYVLSRHWEQDQLWDAEDELTATHETLHRLSIGLLKRCRKKVYIGMSTLDVRGYENRGLLIRIINDVWRRSVSGNPVGGSS